MTEQGSTTFTHRDILLKRGGIVSQRQANKEYHEILKSNVFIYKFLPKVQRTDYAMLIFLFLRNVRKRRLIRYNKSDGTYRELEDERAAAVISAAIRDDKIAKAANQSNPVWLLGLHDPTNFHQGKPFVYRQADGSWAKLTADEAKAVLCSEGSKNLLILPTGVNLCDSGEGNIESSTPLVAAQQRRSSSHVAAKLGCTNLKRPLSQVSWFPSQISLDGDSSTISAVSLEDNESTTMLNDDDCVGPPIKRQRSVPFADETALLLKEFEPSAPFDDVAYSSTVEAGGLPTGEDWAFLSNIFDA